MAVRPVPAVVARDLRRRALVAIAVHRIGHNPVIEMAADGPSAVELLVGQVVDALDDQRALVEALDPPCTAVFEAHGDRVPCDGLAEHTADRHWHVDRRTCRVVSWADHVYLEPRP